MELTEITGGSVNYDEAPIVQREVDGVVYRVDVGRGSSVAVSQRSEGSWDWRLVGEGRWDGTRLRLKELDYPVVSALAAALSSAMKEQEQGSGWG